MHEEKEGQEGAIHKEDWGDDFGTSNDDFRDLEYWILLLRSLHAMLLLRLL